ncbi:sensor histidine kinase [Phormidesmis sp. 146-20]
MNQAELAQQVKTIHDQLKLLQKQAASPSTDPIFETLFSQLQSLEIQTAESPLTPHTQTSEEKWRALSVCSPVGIFTCDVLGHVTYTNPKCQEMGGFTLEESLGKGFADSIHPDDRHRVLTDWFTIAHSGQQHADEFRVLHRDGSLRWLQVRTAPIISDQGELVGHTGTVEDITKQKQSESQIKASLREKEALLKEIHHRVKNNLQIISSLIYLQSQRIDDPQVRQIFEDSQSRINSMALVHDSLYRSNDLTRINLSEYIQSLATRLFYTYRLQSDLVTLRMQVGEEIFISLEKAIPCGLILNELMTNALKHGFSDERSGEIAVLLEAELPQKICLIVENNGNDLPDRFELQTIRSMGLRLVNALVNQIRGSFELEKTNTTRFKVTFDHL